MLLGTLSKATPSYRPQEVLDSIPYLSSGLWKSALKNLSRTNSYVHY